MFDIGLEEALIIGVIAILVIGPKELPIVLRTVGKYVGKAKSMAREFQSSLDEVAREAEMEAVTNSIKKASNPMQAVSDSVKDAVMGNDTVSDKPEKPAAPSEQPAQQTQAAKPGEEPDWLKEYAANATAQADAQEPVIQTNSAPEPAVAEKETVDAPAQKGNS